MEPELVKELPTQKIMAYKGNYSPDSPSPEPDGNTSQNSDMETETASSVTMKRMLLSGGQTPKPKRFHVDDDGPFGKETLTKLRDERINYKTNPDFFNDPREGFVNRFGLQSLFKARLGYCGFSSTYKLYISKENTGGFDPSVLGIRFSDLSELSEIIRKTIGLVSKSKTEGKPIYRYDLTKHKQTKWDNKDFWEHPDTLYTSSGECRLRVIWGLGGIYTYNFNVIQSSPDHPKYFGPKIRLVVMEATRLAEILSEYVYKCPPLQEILAMSTEN